MKFDSFFYALEIADTGSFSQAARNLFLSQPNLSYAIRQLEEELGIQLFLRTTSGVVLTPEGQDVMERFRIIKKEYDQIQEYADRPHQTRQSLRIGSLSSSRAASVFTRMVEKYAGTPIQFSFLNYGSLDELIAEMSGNRVDLAVFGVFSTQQKIAQNKIRQASLEYHILGNNPVCVVVGKENPLYEGEGSVRMADLYPFTAVQYGPTSIDPGHSLLHETGLSLHASGVISVNGSQLFFQIIRNTASVGLVAARPEAFRKYNDMPDIRIREIEDCRTTGQFGWAKLKNLSLPPQAEEYLRILEGLYRTK